jgi:uncharacterized protein (DUF952 family)
MIYHIIHKEDWKKALDENSYTPDSIGKGGFIHCSPAEKISDTLNNFFKGQKDLILISIDESKVHHDIIWEDLYGHNFEFPHIYGKLNLNAVTEVKYINTAADGSFILPDGF